MKAVRFVYKGGTDFPLTIGKIYEVISYNKDNTSSDFVVIINDYGMKEFYYIKDTDGIWFVDATADIREQKLNDIGL